MIGSPTMTAALLTGGGAPAGYTWTTYNGDRLYFNGHPVFDDGRNFYFIG
jgi:hypothetical protein